MASLLKIKFFDNTEEKAFRGGATLDGSLKNFKKFLRKCEAKWQYATVFDKGALHCHFHPTKGTEELDRETYSQALKTDRVNLYIIFTYKHKLETGSHAAKPIYNSSISEMPGYFNSTVDKILAYQNDKIIATFKDGKYI